MGPANRSWVDYYVCNGCSVMFKLLEMFFGEKDPDGD